MPYLDLSPASYRTSFNQGNVFQPRPPEDFSEDSIRTGPAQKSCFSDQVLISSFGELSNAPCYRQQVLLIQAVAAGFLGHAGRYVELSSPFLALQRCGGFSFRAPGAASCNGRPGQSG